MACWPMMSNSRLKRTVNARGVEFITTLPIKIKQRGETHRGM